MTWVLRGTNCESAGDFESTIALAVEHLYHRRKPSFYLIRLEPLPPQD